MGHPACARIARHRAGMASAAGGRGHRSGARKRMAPAPGTSAGGGVAVDSWGGTRGGRARAGNAARLPPSPGPATSDVAVAGGAATRGGGRRSRR